MKSFKTKQNGFTLVELAIVILIMGLIIGATFAYLDVQVQAKHEQVTRDKQKVIAAAMANFAQSYGRLPCPGRPDDAVATLGLPNGYIAGVTPQGVCLTLPLQSGIVPYRILGLNQDDVIDGYGNPISYSVSAAAQSPSATVHEKCRLLNTWTQLLPLPLNYNANKARFCCQQVLQANQIRIYRRQPDNSRVEITTQQPNPALLITKFQVPEFNDTIQAGIADNLSYIAYALVSHGKNGERSFTFGNAGRKPNNQAGNDENINSDTTATREIMDNLRSTGAGATYFDDIVLWRTQDRVMSELNYDSCKRP